MTDLRELFDSPEEGFRSMSAGIRSHLHTAMVSRVTKASDGHVVEVQPAVQQAIKDPTLTQTSYVDYPLVVDSPVHFPGGARMVLSHGLAPGDEVVSLFAENGIDFWHQNSGTAQPVSDRAYSMSDAFTIPGVRSTPRRLQQVDPDAMHLRSEDKRHVSEVHPDKGIRHKSVDPSTPPASPNFDPLTQAAKFIEHISRALEGHFGRAVDGSTEHSHGVDHGVGAWMKAMAPSGLIQALAHPALGALISAADGKHNVTATMGGVMLQSATAIIFDVPPGGLELPSKSVGGAALGAGAAAQNVGQLGGDLGGQLPNPTVLSIAHLVGMDKLPRAGSDAAAGALTPPVPIGSPYLNTTSVSGVSLLCIRTV